MTTQEIVNAILIIVSHIPKGKVTHYGHIAILAGLPGYARFVGSVLKKLPEGSTLPWHRVINSQRIISIPNDSQAFLRQKAALLNEGVTFSATNRINICHMWSPK